jgi:hypothetical protein
MPPHPRTAEHTTPEPFKAGRGGPYHKEQVAKTLQSTSVITRKNTEAHMVQAKSAVDHYPASAPETRAASFASLSVLS